MPDKREFWKEFWNILGDPFSGEPLSYTDEGIDRLIVQTEPIQKVNSIISEIDVPTLTRRYYIIGQRGIGKSTLTNHIIRELLKTINEKKILPIFVNTITEAEDSETLRLNFLISTIEALFQMVIIDLKRFKYSDEKPFPRFLQLRRTYFDQKGMGKIDSRTAEEFLYHLLMMLKDFGMKKFVLLYDELDKIDNYSIVLEFIRKSQSLMENLTGKYDCVVAIAGIPDWVKLLSMEEYGGVRGESISLEPWLPEDAEKLIRLRLKYFTYGKFVNPFIYEVVKELCERARGRPRGILELAKAMLIWGAGQNRRLFERDFCTKMFWRNDSLIRFYDTISTEEALRKGYEKLRRIYDLDKDDPSMYYLLTLIYKVEKYADIPFSELRKRYGIDMDEIVHRGILSRLEAVNGIEKRTEAFSYYTVTKELRVLFQYVTQTLNESLEYLPYVIKMRRPEIVGIVEEFSLRQETIAILSNAPTKNFKVNEIIQILLENPDAKRRAKQHYSSEGKELSDDELRTRLKIGIRQVLKKLSDEGYVLRQPMRKTFVYRWFPKYIDISRFKDLPIDERVIKDLEAAGQNFSSSLYDPAVSTCRSAIENALRVLYESAMKARCPKNMTIDNLNQFLLDKKVYNRGLFSLILGFCQQTNPIVHREATCSEEIARALLDLSQSIIREIFTTRKNIPK